MQKLQTLITENYKNLTEKYLATDVRTLALQKNKFKGIDFQFFITQLALLQRSKDKLPTFYKQRCLFTDKSLQQATSEMLAQWKARRFMGELLVDLTGGLGVDDMAFSNSFRRVLSFDTDEVLNEISRVNFLKLGCNNILRITEEAEQAYTHFESCDMIYIDPDRRPIEGNRISGLDQMLPHIPQMIELYQDKTQQIVIKLSPLFDVSALLNALPNISEVWCIAIKNEMKEVLVLLNTKIQSEVPIIKAVNLLNEVDEQFFSWCGVLSSENKISSEGSYFYEPNHALIHSGLWKIYAREIGCRLIHHQVPYMWSDNLIADYMGRKFEVIKILPYKPESLKRYLSEKGIAQANISRRNFLLSNAEILKILKLKEGGNDYLFFTETDSRRMICVHGKRCI